MSSNEVISEQNARDSSLQKLISGIKQEKITVWGGIRIGLIILILVCLGTNALLYSLKSSPLFSYILLNVPLGLIIIIMLFIPIGIYIQFDYINKGLSVFKYCSIPYILKYCTKKEIPFSEIHHFDINKFILLMKRYYHVGYYDYSNQFHVLVTGQDISCNFEEKFSPELDEIPQKLNDLLKAYVV